MDPAELKVPAVGPTECVVLGHGACVTVARDVAVARDVVVAAIDAPVADEVALPLQAETHRQTMTSDLARTHRVIDIFLLGEGVPLANRTRAGAGRLRGRVLAVRLSRKWRSTKRSRV